MQCTYDIINLPLTRLHHLTAGRGEPLIIVPATISSIDNWLNLVEFMAQKFRVHFFELPGHGKSTPFTEPYSSQLVALTLDQFIHAKGYTSVNLMGFSFGGLLALTTLNHIPKKINRVILFAPCVSYTTLRFSPARLTFLRMIHKTSTHDNIKNYLLDCMHNTKTAPYICSFLHKIGKVEKTPTDTLEYKLLSLPRNTLDVLIEQIHEILYTNFSFPLHHFAHRCYFGMSVNDPLLDYKMTLAYVSRWFGKLSSCSFDVPYHQPPRPLTVKELNSTYGYLLNKM